MSDNKETKNQHSYSGSHRFEAPEEGAARDYEKEREFRRKIEFEEKERKRIFEASKKKSEEINKEYMKQLFGPETTKEQKQNESFNFSLKVLLLGIICCFGSAIYYITETSLIIPLIIVFLVGLTVLILGLYLSYKNF
jgi:Mg2+/citrate symporter